MKTKGKTIQIKLKVVRGRRKPSRWHRKGRSLESAGRDRDLLGKEVKR